MCIDAFTLSLSFLDLLSIIGQSVGGSGFHLLGNMAMKRTRRAISFPSVSLDYIIPAPAQYFLLLPAALGRNVAGWEDEGSCQSFLQLACSTGCEGFTPHCSYLLSGDKEAK